MKISLTNIILIVGLILAEAWFLKGYFSGNPEYEPAIAFIVTFGAIFAKDPIKEKFTGSGESNLHDKNLNKASLSASFCASERGLRRRVWK